MTQYQLFKDFVNKIENKTEAYCNYSESEYGEGYIDVEVWFKGNERKSYSYLLSFCGTYEVIVLSTNPKTYETVIRLEH